MHLKGVIQAIPQIDAAEAGKSPFRTETNYKESMMNYSFICPAPCNNKIIVLADNYDDAAGKLVEAGALRCRNDRYGCYCEKSWHDMTSIPEDQLRNIIMMCIQEEPEKPKDNKYISSSLYS